MKKLKKGASKGLPLKMQKVLATLAIWLAKHVGIYHADRGLPDQDGSGPLGRKYL